MQIEDGKGKGYKAGVNNENKLLVFATTQPASHHANHEEGEAYTFYFNCEAVGADDCILYMKNTDDVDMVIDGMWINTGGTIDLYFKLGATGTAGGTSESLVPANRNAGSGKSATGTFESDDDGTATDITGLSGGTEVERWHIETETTSEWFDFHSDLIIPKNSTFSMWTPTAGRNVKGTVYFFYHD